MHSILQGMFISEIAIRTSRKTNLNHALKLQLLRTLSTNTTTTQTQPNFIVQTHVSPPTFPNLRPLNSTISDLMRRGLVDDAQKLFDETPHRNTVTWNAMVRGYFCNGMSVRAVKMFDEMPESDLFTYNTVVAGLMQCGDVDGAVRVFGAMSVRDVVTWNSMISGYVRNGMVRDGIRVFDEMPVKDVVSWNLVIGGLVTIGDFDLARDYFRRMSTRDFASWTIMMSGLASAGRISEARELFDEMPCKDGKAWNTMITAYIKKGDIEIAEALFHKMPDWDFDSWNEMIIGLLKHRRAINALKVFLKKPIKSHQLLNAVVFGIVRKGLVREAHAVLEKIPYSTVVSWTNVIVGYFKNRDIENAVSLFEVMKIRDTTVYTVTISGLGENDCGEKGIEIFARMRQCNELPDEATITSVLKICSDLRSLHLGRQTHSLVKKSGFDSFVATCNATITMYARCGDMNSALLEFSTMATSRDIVTWNSIICGLSHYGNGEKALEMFEKMRSENFKPDNITFVGVLSACSHAGLVDSGRHFFDMMRNEYFLRPTSEHYTCLVDLLGRSGLIDDAVNLLGQMRDNRVKIPTSAWGALFGACRMHNNIGIAEIAGERILETEPWNSGVYLILAEMYLSCGRKKEAEMVWRRLRNSGVKKQPGCSWVEIDNVSHVFLSADHSHSEFPRISYVLKLLHREMEIKTTKNV